MTAPLHLPFGTNPTSSPFDDPGSPQGSFLFSAARRMTTHSLQNSPDVTAALSFRSPNQLAVADPPLAGSGSRLGSGSHLGSGRSSPGLAPVLPPAAIKHQPSDFNASSSGLMSSSLTHSPSAMQRSRMPPSQIALPVPVTRLRSVEDVPAVPEQHQQRQLSPHPPPPAPLQQVPCPPRRVLSPPADPSPAELDRNPSAQSAPDNASTTQAPSTTPRRSVAFADISLADTMPAPLVVSPFRQTSSGFTDTHASLLNVLDSHTTQRPSDVGTPAARVYEDLDATIPKQMEVSSPVDTEARLAEADGVSVAPNPHARKSGTYAHLAIQKPTTSDGEDVVVPLAAVNPTLAGGDPTVEAQIRAAGTSGTGGGAGSALLPVFDRAKQALFSPGLGSSISPRLRHARTGCAPVDDPLASTMNSGGSGTPKSTLRGRGFSMLITPLLRTPMSRQQSSGVNSPLVVDRSVLEEPAHTPATFGDRMKELRDDEDGVTTHSVWQMREGQTRYTLSPSFLLISEGDRVCIHWYDGAEEVFETDATYLSVVPGGRHSCYNAVSTPEEDAAVVGGGMPGALEMQTVHNAPTEGNQMELSHTLGRLSGPAVKTSSNNSSMEGRSGAELVTKTQLDMKKGNQKGSAPLVISVRTPRPGRRDSLGSADSTTGGVGASFPAMARAGTRARRLASEVFLAREEDAAGGDGSFPPSALSEVNMFANGNTPTFRGHSRQLSTNWTLQRSVTRQALGENYQSFTVAFPRPGDYYFVCSKHKRAMRLHVQVQSHRSSVVWRYVLLIGAAVLVVALIVIVVVVLAYWMQHSTYLFGEKDTATSAQYLAFLDIHDLITLKLFPFLAVCVIIVLLVIVGVIGWTVFRCFHPARQGAYTRGVYASTRRVLHLGTALLTCALIALLFVAFGLEMNVMNGVNKLAFSIGSGVTNTLNLYSTAVLQVNYIVNETAVLFPAITLPTSKIYSITDEVSSLIDQIVSWTSFVEDIAQVAFRAIPIVIYLSMQLGLFAACLTIGALILRFRKVAAVTTWMLAASVGIFSLVCGIEFTVTKLFSTLYSSVVVLRDNPQDFGSSIGLANNSFVSQLLSYCTITVGDVSVIADYVNDILSKVNETLDSDGQKEFSALFAIIHDVVPTTLEALANYSDYIIANSEALQNILDKNGAEVNEAVHQNVVPLLTATLGVIQTFKGLANCQVIRDIVAAAIPIFKDEVQNYNLAVFSFLLIAFGISFILLVFSTGSAYALRHPRRTWCNMRTGRWFRFRYSYKTHLSTLMMGAQSKARERTVLQWLVQHTEPIMYQLQSTKLVCYSACALMFFDCILIVLFNEVSRGTRTSKMLKALSYMGCATLFFLLLAALFRRALIRWIFHCCALLCAAACLGVSAAQSIVGYVSFAQCVDHTRYEMGSMTYASPVYVTCSATYMGYSLEVAIYSTVIFLNSITLVVTLAIQIRYERYMRASLALRHYVGVLSPLEKVFPWLKWVFSDYLLVKRIYHGLLIFIVVIFLVLFAVLDVGQLSVIRGVTKSATKNSGIVQVIDPNKGCNGDMRYCNLRVNEIIWACAHNAHSSLEDGFVLSNHYYNISHQLSAGIRSFMVDVWYDKINATLSDEVDVYVCHQLCLIGRRRWRDIAREFKEFLDQYPEQIIMIIFEQYVNSSSLGQISDDVGLTQYVWWSDQVAPNFNPDYKWPTLRQLIDKGQRAMVFNDVMAYLPMSTGCPEWLYYSFDFQYENFYTTTSEDNWVCDIHRGWCTDDPPPGNSSDSSSSSSSSSAMNDSSTSSSLSMSSSSDSQTAFLHAVDVTNCTVYGADPLWHNGSAVYNAAFHTNPPNVRSKLSTMNHFITVGAGSPMAATQANQVLQVQSTTYMCSSTWNTVVNILAFDFWSIANPLGTIEAMNQNIARYGSRFNFQKYWSKILFDMDRVNFSDS